MGESGLKLKKKKKRYVASVRLCILAKVVK